MYLLVVAILTWLGVITVAPVHFFRALTFTSDYLVRKDWYLGHSWSLSVEEQFYLVWPVLMYLCRRRTLVSIASGVIVLAPLVRAATYLLDPAVRPIIPYMAHTRADMISFGCVSALLLDSEVMNRLIRKVVRGRFAAAAALFLLIVSPILDDRLKGGYLFLVGYTLQGLCITLVMLYLVLYPATKAGRFFNSRMLTHIGVLSYSLYLWQEIFLGGARQTPVQIVAGVAMAFVAAEASYHWVESPMLGLRVRLEHRHMASREPSPVTP